MPQMQLTLEKADIIQAIRDYLQKLGYAPKGPLILNDNEIPNITLPVEKYHKPSYGSCEKS